MLVKQKKSALALFFYLTTLLQLLLASTEVLYRTCYRTSRGSIVSNVFLTCIRNLDPTSPSISL